MTKPDSGTLQAREVAPEDWGKVMLEEILFRAARDLSAQALGATEVTVSIEFKLAPDIATRTIEISTPGASSR
jgi:hypothetical protein